MGVAHLLNSREGITICNKFNEKIQVARVSRKGMLRYLALLCQILPKRLFVKHPEGARYARQRNQSFLKP